MKQTLIRRISLLSAVLLFGVGAHAATVSVSFLPASTAPDAPFVGSIWLESDGDTLNAVEGSIAVPEGITISSVSTGDSQLSLWPVLPVFVIKDRTLSFTGGTPKPLSAHTRSLLFSFTGSTHKSGTYTFSSKHIVAYKSDGKGTMLPATFRSSVLTSASGNKSNGEIPKDKTAPVFVDVAIGTDTALFGGKYFVTFAATDSGSGVQYYEVQEGMFAPFSRTDRYYVLKDQTLGTAVTVRAVDTAGNAATKTVPAAHPNPVPYFLIVGIVVGTVVLVLWRRRKQKK